MQGVPVDHEGSAGRFVLLLPVDQQFQAGVINVMEMIQIDVQLDIRRHFRQDFGELIRAAQGRP